LTGPPELETGQEVPALPKLRTFWVTWFDPEFDIPQKVTLEAHDVRIYDDGMLVFLAWKTDPTIQPPVVGRFVRGFRNHITWGEIDTEGTVN
jgi:hypothetical protein